MSYDAMDDALMEIVKDKVDEKVNTAVSTAEAAKEQQTTVSHIRDVMDAFGVTIEKAMESLKIPDSQRSMYAGLVGRSAK